jgi:SAM-dependent methyltransferase
VSNNILETHIKKNLQEVVRVKDMNINLDSHHYIVLSLLYVWMKEHALPVAEGVMLDFGCGGQPYKSFFEGKITKYIGADVAAAENTTLDIEIVPNQPLPLLDESVDTVLSTQTLEHVFDVHFYLNECHRILKPNGVLILTAPMQWRHHEVPYDFLRFTRYGLIEYLSQHGFEIDNITPCGGVYALIGQIFLNHLAERKSQKKFIFRFINRLSLWLDKKSPDTEDTINWMCIAVKRRKT